MIKIWMWKLDGSNDYNAAFPSLLWSHSNASLSHPEIYCQQSSWFRFYQCVDNKEAINQKTKTFLKNRLYAIIDAITVNYFIIIIRRHQEYCDAYCSNNKNIEA